MESMKDFCLYCMHEKEGKQICPYCGRTGTPKQDYDYGLPIGIGLQEGRYIIGKIFRIEQDGLVYVAYDCIEKIRVTVKEFFVNELCFRKQDNSVNALPGKEELFQQTLREFLKYNRTIARLREEPCIPSIYDIFLENSTAYLIFEAQEGASTLREFLREKDNIPEWEEVRWIFLPLLSTLEAMHASEIGHYGINPDCILILPGHKIQLIQYEIPSMHKINSNFSVNLEKHYAAPEQYVKEGKLQVHTDIYALAACIYFVLSGNEVKNALERRAEPQLMITKSILQKMPPSVVMAISSGLKLEPNERSDNLQKYRVMLNGVTMENKPQKEEAPVREKEKRFSGFAMASLAFGGTLAVLLIFGVLYWILTSPAKNVNTSSVHSSLPSSVSSSDKGDTNSEASSLTEDYIRVPMLIGEKISSVQGSNALVVLISDYAFDDSIEEGCIISQTIEEGKMVPEGTIIAVLVSKGNELRELPPVKGKTLEEAKSILYNAGFDIGKISYSQTDENDSGKVLSFSDSSLQEGKKYPYRKIIDLIVGK